MFGMRKTKSGDHAAGREEKPKCRFCGSENIRRFEVRSLYGCGILGGAVRVMRGTVCRDCGKKDIMLF